MNEPLRSFTELVSLSESTERQEELNAANIGNFLETLERLFSDEMRLREEVWVDQGIREYSATIFGWSLVESAWHISVGERETCVDPDGETVMYASSKKRLLGCDIDVQIQFLRHVTKLIQQIERNLRARQERAQIAEQVITQQIREVAEILGGEGPNTTIKLTGPASRLLGK